MNFSESTAHVACNGQVETELGNFLGKVRAVLCGLVLPGLRLKGRRLVLETCRDSQLIHRGLGRYGITISLQQCWLAGSEEVSGTDLH